MQTRRSKNKTFIMRTSILTITAGLALLAFSSCTVVRPGEAGVKQTLGKLSNQVSTQGPVFYNPLTTKVEKPRCRPTISNYR